MGVSELGSLFSGGVGLAFGVWVCSGVFLGWWPSGDRRYLCCFWRFHFVWESASVCFLGVLCYFCVVVVSVGCRRPLEC
jgi:hypothetical protein